MARPSVMKHNFSQIPRANIPRSRFDRSHGYKTTFDAGYLIPFFVDEVLPGDTFTLSATIFGRLATPIVPIMDNMFLETFFFFVPNRLVWENWERFNGEQENPGDSTDYLVPQVHFPNGPDVGSVGDYFGLPTGGDYAGLLSVSALPFRAYNLTWNEWFRDQNLQESVDVPKDDGPDTNGAYNLLRRGKRHDYFTSCLPWPQKGPGVELPLGSSVPVTIPAMDVYGTNLQFATNAPFKVRDRTEAIYPDKEIKYYPDVAGGPAAGGILGYETLSASGSMPGPVYWPTTVPLNSTSTIGLTKQQQVNVDLSEAQAATINSLRQAFQIQKLLERDARGGTRYTELLRSHFGVVSPDARLQRPEYLGGSSTRINVNPVQQTSATDEISPQGNLAAFGVVGDSFHGFTKSFVEHGYIIGLVNVRADLTYQQGVARHFSRKTRFDFYWPALAYLGEQAVLNKEIYFTGVPEQDDGVFGYQERWAEYRYFPSRITGKFRSMVPDTLDYWHLSQKFTSTPVLNAEFIQDDPPIDRVIAIPSEPHFLLDCYFRLRCARPMPVYSVPGLIDHF